MIRAVLRRRQALRVGCTAHAVQDGLGAATYVLLPVLAQAYGFGYAQAGLLKGAYSLSQSLLEFASGAVSEQIGAGRSLVLGLALAGVGYAVLAAAEHAAVVLICLVVAGVGGAFQHAPASTLVSAAHTSGGRLSAMGLYNASGDVGKLVFAGCFSVAIGAGVLWQQITLVYGLVAIAGAIAISITTRGEWSTSVRAGREAASGPDTPTLPTWGVLDRRAFSVLLVVVGFDNIVQASVLVFISFAMLAKGHTLAVATLATVVVLLGGVFGKAGCGYLAQSIGVRRAFVLVQILTAACLTGVMLAPQWIAFGLLLPLGVVLQGSTSISYALVPDLIHADRLAHGFALMYATTSFAAATGAFATGLVADQFGIGSAMLAMSILTLLSVLPAMYSTLFD